MSKKSNILSSAVLRLESGILEDARKSDGTMLLAALLLLSPTGTHLVLYSPEFGDREGLKYIRQCAKDFVHGLLPGESLKIVMFETNMSELRPPSKF